MSCEQQDDQNLTLGVSLSHPTGCLPSFPATHGNAALWSTCGVTAAKGRSSDRVVQPFPQAGTWICPLNCSCTCGSCVMSKSLPSLHLKLHQKLVEMKEGEGCLMDLALLFLLEVISTGVAW